MLDEVLNDCVVVSQAKVFFANLLYFGLLLSLVCHKSSRFPYVFTQNEVESGWNEVKNARVLRLGNASPPSLGLCPYSDE